MYKSIIWRVRNGAILYTEDKKALKIIGDWAESNDVRVMADYYDCKNGGKWFAGQIIFPKRLINRVAKLVGLPGIDNQLSDKQLEALEKGRMESSLHNALTRGEIPKDDSADFEQETPSQEEDDSSGIL